MTLLGRMLAENPSTFSHFWIPANDFRRADIDFRAAALRSKIQAVSSDASASSGTQKEFAKPCDSERAPPGSADGAASASQKRYLRPLLEQLLLSTKYTIPHDFNFQTINFQKRPSK